MHVRARLKHDDDDNDEDNEYKQIKAMHKSFSDPNLCAGVSPGDFSQQNPRRPYGYGKVFVCL